MSQEFPVTEGLDEDAWMNCMRERLASRSDDGPFHKEHLIYRVHSALRNGNASSYEPMAISLGPYHRGKKHLLAFETHKKRWFRQLLLRNRNVGFEVVVKMIKDCEDRVRGCYPEKIELASEAFVEMLLLDGCCIVELLLKLKCKQFNDDLFVGPVWRQGNLLHHDLLLLENQLPFFLLHANFQLVMPNETDPEQALVKLSLEFLQFIGLYKTLINEQVPVIDPKSVHHLIHLWHTQLIQFPAAEQPQVSKILNLSPCLGMCNCCQGTAQEQQKPNWMPGVKQLEEAGVKFKPSSGHSLDIKFCNGEMIIPKISLAKYTEAQLRNLVAFEQCCLQSSHFYFSSYVCFLYLLINSSKDVEILHKNDILTFGMGDDAQVARLIDNLTEGVIDALKISYLANTIKSVNEYRSREIPKWRASLVRDYFYSPWAIFSFIAAIVALSLTAIQTVYSVHQPKK